MLKENKELAIENIYRFSKYGDTIYYMIEAAKELKIKTELGRPDRLNSLRTKMRTRKYF